MEIFEKTKERFKSDCFATEVVGIEILDVKKSWAKCKLDITPKHLNARGSIMGGVIFTLADFAFAVAANTGDYHTVTVESHMSFLNEAKGNILYAETHLEKEGHRLCTFRINIVDELGIKVATSTISGMRLSDKI